MTLKKAKKLTVLKHLLKYRLTEVNFENKDVRKVSKFCNIPKFSCCDEIKVC